MPRPRKLRGPMQTARIHRYTCSDAVNLYTPRDWPPGERFDYVDYGDTEKALHFHENGKYVVINPERHTVRMNITKMFPDPTIVKRKTTVIPACIKGNYLIFDPTPALELTPTGKMVAAE